ncbi:MAG: hypothetical protein WC812_02855 [Candidatus Pacearchaeota archaeon]|jgi:hypothetical protein
MHEEKLSDLEIKLINTTLKFLKNTNHSMEFYKDNKTNSSSITLRADDGQSMDYACITYSGNAEKDEIKFEGPKHYSKEIKKKYKIFLIKEIPEIKNRIKEV